MYHLLEKTRNQSHPLTGVVVEIGRSVDCTISLAHDLKVSRQHARLERNRDEWHLLDLGSANGTYVNDQKIRQVKLKVGDRIRMGDTVFEFLPLASHDSEGEATRVDATRPDSGSTGGKLFRWFEWFRR